MMQQITGVINLSLPVIMVYQLYPALLYTYWGIFICALVIGIVTYYLNRRATVNMVRALTYHPSLAYQQRLASLMQQCGINPKDVILIYAYTNEQIIISAFNTLILDPVLWSSLADDSEARKVIEIFETHTLPTLSSVQKQRIETIKTIFPVEAQSFFFKRQLAHIYNHFTTKKLFVIGFVATLAAYISILAAMSVVHISGLLAIGVGIVTGFVTDLAFTYLSNLFFKLKEEKAADLFAAHYSSHKEIEAAIFFLEEHKKMRDSFKNPPQFLDFVPYSLATGHYDSVTRANYLREVAHKK